MTLKIERRTFLQALIAAGASFTLPVKPTKAQIDKVWAEAQANPLFFEVDKYGTLIEDGIPAPETWADVFDITTDCIDDANDLIAEVNGCPPLSSALIKRLDREIDGIEHQLAHADNARQDTGHDAVKRLEALKQAQGEDDPAISWIELEGNVKTNAFRNYIDDWLAQPVDWMQSEWFPAHAGAQGQALAFFENQPQELLKALGVVIVDGEHPGSTYYAAELRTNIADANASAQRLGLPFRFKLESTGNDGEKSAQ